MEVDRHDEPLLSAREAEPDSVFSLERILVPVDFSACSLKALRYAVPFAKQFAARLLLVYVAPDTAYVGGEFGPVEYPVPAGPWREERQKQLAALAEREVGTSAPWDVSVRQGHPAHGIADAARERGVDLIVLSTHGRTGLRHVLMGSIAENVVRYAPCPVLVVREHGHEFIRESTGESQGMPQPK